jgi:hypothetical protein
VPVVDLATFRTRYPEFDDVPDPTAQLQLDDAEADTSANFFEDMHARAIQALTAHRLAIGFDEDGNPTGGQPGALIMAAVDGVQSQYEIPEGLSAADIGFWSTAYGQSYLEIRNRFGHGPYVVR